MSVLDQDNWVERLQGDDADRNIALGELRELLLRGLTRSLSSRTGQFGGGLHAEDIVQEALIKILAGLDSFEGRSKFTTWAMTIATRVGISELRKRYTKNISLNQLDRDEAWTVDVAAEPTSNTDRREQERDRIIKALHDNIENNLTDRQRFAIRALLEGVPVENIASRTDSNRNAVYKLVHDARTRLRSGFEKAGISADDILVLLD